MKVFIECLGRLANQLLCISNASYWSGVHGFRNREFVVNYRELESPRVSLPSGFVAKAGSFPEDLPKLASGDIAKTSADCIWEWPDVYFKMAPTENLIEGIRSVRLNGGFSEAVKRSAFGRIGIHARFGDFSPAGTPGADFLRAPSEYYLDAISKCKRMGHNSFYLATDGTDDETRFLYEAGGVERGRPDDPLFDLFALASSRAIIGSDSTFSWVASLYSGIKMCSPKSPDMTEFPHP